METKPVALDVPRGSGYDSQSGLNNLFPQFYGRLADEGCGKRIAFVVIHSTSNFMSHYLLGPMQRRGHAILGLNTLLRQRFGGGPPHRHRDRAQLDGPALL